MKFCLVSFRYPGSHNQSDWAFVKQLVDAIASLGNECFVLSPYNLIHYRKFISSREEYIVGLGSVQVFRPWYLSFSKFRLGKFSLSEWAHKRALSVAFKRLKVRPDIVYCHFWNAGYEAYSLIKETKIPLFVASGESDIKSMFSFPSDVSAFKDYVSGVVCVSTKNRDESIALNLTTPQKSEVFPNSINARLFFYRDKTECRKTLGIPLDVFVVAFVGWFNERKGVLRVEKAIEEIDGVYSIFIGKGELEPLCKGILFKGSLPHDKIPIYLGAADVFVLPTLHEGCCNAIVEAMACGLPIISSNLPFNFDVLDKSNSILIDPTNIMELSKAIRDLKDNPLKRESLSRGALERAKSLTIENRASSILSFIRKMLN